VHDLDNRIRRVEDSCAETYVPRVQNIMHLFKIQKTSKAKQSSSSVSTTKSDISCLLTTPKQYISDLMIYNMKDEQAKQERALFFLFIHCLSFLFKVAKIDNFKFDRYFFPAQFRVRNHEVFKKCESLYATGKYSFMISGCLAGPITK